MDLKIIVIIQQVCVKTHQIQNILGGFLENLKDFNAIDQIEDSRINNEFTTEALESHVKNNDFYGIITDPRIQQPDKVRGITWLLAKRTKNLFDGVIEKVDFVTELKDYADNKVEQLAGYAEEWKDYVDEWKDYADTKADELVEYADTKVEEWLDYTDTKVQESRINKEFVRQALASHVKNNDVYELIMDHRLQQWDKMRGISWLLKKRTKNLFDGLIEKVDFVTELKDYADTKVEQLAGYAEEWKDYVDEWKDYADTKADELVEYADTKVETLIDYTDTRVEQSRISKEFVAKALASHVKNNDIYKLIQDHSLQQWDKMRGISWILKKRAKNLFYRVSEQLEKTKIGSTVKITEGGYKKFKQNLRSYRKNCKASMMTKTEWAKLKESIHSYSEKDNGEASQMTKDLWKKLKVGFQYVTKNNYNEIDVQFIS